MPTRPSASATSAAVWASIGWTGRKSSSRNEARPSAPSVSAARATSTRPPASMVARRTSVAGRSAALATASSMTPSRAPCRRPPWSTPRRSRCSGSVARSKRRRRSRFRASCDPGPEAAAEPVERLRDVEHLERLGRRGLRELTEGGPADPEPGEAAGQHHHRERDLVGAQTAEAVGEPCDLGRTRARLRDRGRGARELREAHRPIVPAPSPATLRRRRARRPAAGRRSRSRPGSIPNFSFLTLSRSPPSSS